MIHNHIFESRSCDYYCEKGVWPKWAIQFGCIERIGKPNREDYALGDDEYPLTKNLMILK